MKDLDQLNFGDNLLYAEDHEWIQSGGETLKIGVSDYAQDQMGDIVFVELPEVGDSFEKGDQFGTLESVKAVSELYLPIGGEIIAVNEELVDAPELLNQEPYAQWIVEVKPSDVSELDELMSEDAYKSFLKG